MHLNVRIDSELKAKLDAELRRVNTGRDRQIRLSSLVRILVMAGLEKDEGIRDRLIDMGPLQAPAECQLRWQRRVGKRSDAAERLEQRRNDLFRRFDSHCDKVQLNMPQFAEAIMTFNDSLEPQVCADWYYQGKIPAGSETAEMLLDSVERLLAATTRPQKDQGSPATPNKGKKKAV